MDSQVESCRKPMEANKTQKRNMSVEILRLVSIVGISIFHVFIPWFFGLTHMEAASAFHGMSVSADVVQALAESPWVMWLLGLLSLMGAFGNHVFYMISAFYLLPPMIKQVGNKHYWRHQLRAGVRRCSMVLAAVAFYVVLLGLLDLFVIKIPGAFKISWVSTNLEFIWLYVLFVLFAPLWAWLVRTFADHLWARIVFVLLTATIYFLNFYIAFIAQGDTAGRGLLDWRKQMSALTYLASFALSGALSWFIANRKQEQAHTARTILSARFWGLSFFATIGVSFAVTGFFAWNHNYSSLYNLSFKSTSLLSFLLALSATFWCALRSQAGDSKHSTVDSVIVALASGILGFYIVQALSYGLWDPFCFALLSHVADKGPQLIFILAAFAFAVVFALIVVIFDRWVRQPLLRLVGLSK